VPSRVHGHTTASCGGTEARQMRSILLYFLGVPVVVIVLLNVFNVI
jgi:hypothetical protein